MHPGAGAAHCCAQIRSHSVTETIARSELTPASPGDQAERTVTKQSGRRPVVMIRHRRAVVLVRRPSQRGRRRRGFRHRAHGARSARARVLPGELRVCAGPTVGRVLVRRCFVARHDRRRARQGIGLGERRLNVRPPTPPASGEARRLARSISRQIEAPSGERPKLCLLPYPPSLLDGLAHSDPHSWVISRERMPIASRSVVAIARLRYA